MGSKKNIAVSLIALLTVGSATVAVIPNTYAATTKLSGSLTVWSVESGNDQKVVQSLVNRFNKSHPSVNASVQFFQTEPFKQKLQITMGAHTAPDVFDGWGGGPLQTYVSAGDVFNLTSALKSDPSWKNRFLPAIMKAVTFGGKVYGIPNSYVQPVMLFYNKALFKQYKLTPPKTWSQFNEDIKVFKQHGIIPLTLGGLEKWPILMWEEYLVDRFGGPQPFDNVLAGKANAWSNPAFIKANSTIVQLVKEGAFEPGATAVSFNNGSSTALLYTNKAAMELMGTWEFNGIMNSDPQFIQNNDLGYIPFPTVPGEKGNPNDIVGNPSTYYSISTDSKNKQAAVAFLRNAVMNSQNVKDFVNAGDVPPVKGLASELKHAPNGAYLSAIYNMVQSAPNFQMSWDEALSPAQGQQLLTDLESLILGQLTPQQFSQDMNKHLRAVK